MSQPFNVVMMTADLMRNLFNAGYRASVNQPISCNGRYIEFIGINEDGTTAGVEYDTEDSIDQKSIKYLMDVLQDILAKNNRYNEYWGDS